MVYDGFEDFNGLIALSVAADDSQCCMRVSAVVLLFILVQ
jgi:hypothetical protein